MATHNRKQGTRNSKTLSRRKTYAKKKSDLVQYLGGCCRQCGSIIDLTFDHIDGRDWDIRAVHSTKRIRIYREEAEQGLLQLLCLSCNSAKGDPRSNQPEEPF